MAKLCTWWRTKKAIYYININIVDNTHHPEYMCRKYYLLMTNSMKRKTTIKFPPFSEWNPHITNCYICSKLKLLRKGRIATQKLKSPKIALGRTKADINTSGPKLPERL